MDGILLCAGIVLGTCAIIILGRYLHENYPKTFRYFIIWMCYVGFYLAFYSLIEEISSLRLELKEFINILSTLMYYLGTPLVLLTVATFFRELSEEEYKQYKANKANVSYLKDYRPNQ